MGIDGIILCDCFETDRALAPPFPLVRRGWYFTGAPGFEGQDDVRRDEVLEWERTACEHPYLHLVDNKLRRRELLEAMDDHGGLAAFPAILAALPHGNDGDCLPPEEAARCLAELDRLNDLMAPSTMAAVVDADRGTILFGASEPEMVGFPRRRQPLSHIRIYTDGTIHGLTPEPGTAPTTSWLKPDAVVRVKHMDGTILFESHDFTQERSGDDWTFRDAATGATVRHSSPIAWPWPDNAPADEAPRRLRVETRPIDIAYCLKGVGRLRELFETSARTGRPIYWV
ncbi:MAG: hypothetical protein HOV76_31890 [Hamadaea sp.]|nr:hypothetical protein [Hamadaea sp.]